MALQQNPFYRSPTHTNKQYDVHQSNDSDTAYQNNLFSFQMGKYLRICQSALQNARLPLLLADRQILVFSYHK